MKKTTILILLSFAFMALSAKVYYVSPDGDNSDGTTWEKAFTSILEAQAKVESPAEIWVKQGTYNVTDTTLTIMNGISVYGGFAGTETSFDARSTDPSLTILKGNNQYRVVTAASDISEETIWDGFTIQDGTSATGGGVYLRGNTTMSNCIIQNNTNKTNSGGGVYIATNDTDSVKLINCTVRNNTVIHDGTSTSPIGGGGAYIHNNSHAALISNCSITNNILNGDSVPGAKMFGGGIFMNVGTILNSVISENEVTSITRSGEFVALGEISGGGIMIMTPAEGNILIQGCKIENNSAPISQGGGITMNAFWEGNPINAKVTVENTIISNNYSKSSGGGVFMKSENQTSAGIYLFLNCVIANNEAEINEGAGVFISNKSPADVVKFVGNTIVNNYLTTGSQYGGAGIYYNFIAADIINCLFWGNFNSYEGDRAPKHHLRNKDIAGNTITYCAFDTRFQESDIVAPATLENLVSLDLANDGAGDSFVKFKNPTTFVGIAKTEEQKQEIAKADWSLTEGSACIDKGATERTYNYDINGAERGMGEGYDIGAYEYDPNPQSSVKTPSSEAFIAYGIQGGIVIENTDNFTQASVYNLQGTHCRTIELSAGQNTINIDSGLYIIKIENNAAKVLVK